MWVSNAWKKIEITRGGTFDIVPHPRTMSAISTATKKPTELRQRATDSSSETAVTDEGRKTDKLLDSHTR